METQVFFTSRTTSFENDRTVGRDFVLGDPETRTVFCEVRASWSSVVTEPTAIVWVMMGHSSAMYEIPVAERMTADDLINLGVAVVARVAPSYHPLWDGK